jgi:hypothetical protein
MELETKITKDVDGKANAKEETIRHWSDKEMKEIHKANGKTWRSNRQNLKVRPLGKKFREGYDLIDWGRK